MAYARLGLWRRPPSREDVRSGHVAIGRKAIFGLDQYFAGEIYQESAKGMISARSRAAHQVKRAPKSSLIIQLAHRLLQQLESGVEFFCNRLENTIGLERGFVEADTCRVEQRVAHCRADRVIRAFAHRLRAERSKGI